MPNDAIRKVVCSLVTYNVGFYGFLNRIPIKMGRVSDLAPLWDFIFVFVPLAFFIFHKELSSKERFSFTKIPHDVVFKETHSFLAG